jgi:hypothetical protein
MTPGSSSQGAIVSRLARPRPDRSRGPQGSSRLHRNPRWGYGRTAGALPGQGRSPLCSCWASFYPRKGRNTVVGSGGRHRSGPLSRPAPRATGFRLPPGFGESASRPRTVSRMFARQAKATPSRKPGLAISRRSTERRISTRRASVAGRGLPGSSHNQCTREASSALIKPSWLASIRAKSAGLPRNSRIETSPSRLRSILRNQSGVEAG